MVYICEIASTFGWGRPLRSLSVSAQFFMQLGSLIRYSRKTFVSFLTVSSSSGVFGLGPVRRSILWGLGRWQLSLPCIHCPTWQGT